MSAAFLPPYRSPVSVTRVSTTRDDADLIARLGALLATTRTVDGGWATATGRDADAESTAWVLIGAALVPSLATYRDSAATWLAAQQRTDGSWSYRRGQEIATWPTHAALLALTLAEGPRVARSHEARTKAVAWIVQEHSATHTTWQRVVEWTRERFADRSVPTAEPTVVLDGTLDGFGWARETFAWVEPTAIAMLAMATQPPTHPASQALRRRLGIGARLLLDRQAPDGGWNYGNKRVLGFDLPGYPDTTGWALLGLAAAVRAGVIDAPLVFDARARAFAALARPESPMVSPLPAALAVLARSAFGLANDSTHAAAKVASLAPFRAALTSALNGVRDGYPLLESRSAVLALCALHDVDLLVGITR